MANMLKRDLEALVRRIEAADGARVASDPWRQRFHLEPPVGWLNDPNGLCRWGEWYHIFYQYSPFDARGGIKLWGHYRSRDLLHFERLQPMLYPDQPWDLHGVYSGSALVEDDAMYLYYTGNVKHEGDFDYITAGRGHNTALAVSRDGVTVERKNAPAGKSGLPGGSHLPRPRPQGLGAGRAVLSGAGRPHPGGSGRAPGL